jgi:hypothetical protein
MLRFFDFVESFHRSPIAQWSILPKCFFYFLLLFETPIKTVSKEIATASAALSASDGRCSQKRNRNAKSNIQASIQNEATREPSRNGKLNATE